MCRNHFSFVLLRHSLEGYMGMGNTELLMVGQYGIIIMTF